MKILNYLIIALCFLMINASSCFDKDDEDKLPPETQTGNNTFGCLVNGKVWLPRGVPFSSVGTVAWVNSSYNYLSVGANQDNSQSIGFVLKDTEINSGMVYTLNSNVNSHADFESRCETGAYCYYGSNSKNVGELTITKFDTINMIVSGLFSFKAYFTEAQASDCGCDSLFSITEGRFDLKYSLQP
ncbi:MAG: DUF6252 family protein [Bacteroidales bacterium]